MPIVISASTYDAIGARLCEEPGAGAGGSVAGWIVFLQTEHRPLSEWSC